ncbi:calcium-binding protein, partial [Tropicimonas sp. TH_r6]
MPAQTSSPLGLDIDGFSEGQLYIYRMLQGAVFADIGSADQQDVEDFLTESYALGQKVFFFATASELAGAQIMIDVHDYLGLTPEGQQGWSSVWLNGGLGVETGLGDIGFVVQAFNDGEPDPAMAASLYSQSVDGLTRSFRIFGLALQDEESRSDGHFDFDIRDSHAVGLTLGDWSFDLWKGELDQSLVDLALLSAISHVSLEAPPGEAAHAVATSLQTTILDEIEAEVSGQIRGFTVSDDDVSVGTTIGQGLIFRESGGLDVDLDGTGDLIFDLTGDTQQSMLQLGILNTALDDDLANSSGDFSIRFSAENSTDGWSVHALDGWTNDVATWAAWVTSGTVSSLPMDMDYEVQGLDAGATAQTWWSVDRADGAASVGILAFELVYNGDLPDGHPSAESGNVLSVITLSVSERDYLGDTTSDAYFGSGRSDRLIGDSDDNSLYGFDGDDILIGYHGTDRLLGGSGNDLYIYSPDSGLQAIVDEENKGGHDIVQFGSPSDVMVSLVSYSLSDDFRDLIITFGNDVDDTLQIRNQGVEGSQVEELHLFDGENDLLPAIDLVSKYRELLDAIGAAMPAPSSELSVISPYQYVTGTPLGEFLARNGGETLLGGGGADHLKGGTGDDTLFGQAEDDILTTGETGTEILHGGSGNDLYVIERAAGTEYRAQSTTVNEDAGGGTDTLDLTGFVSSLSALDFETSGYDLVIHATHGLGNHLSAVTLSNHFYSSSARIETLTFDSQSWDISA